MPSAGTVPSVSYENAPPVLLHPTGRLGDNYTLAGL